jgi:DNA modification methylase
MPANHERHVGYLPLDEIVPATRNPKRHDGDGIRASIDRFGVGELPLLDERTGRLVAGHGRIDQLAAMHAAGQEPPDGVSVDAEGRWLVPVTRGWASRSDAEAEAYLLASNKLTFNGGWDDGELAELLAGLADDDPDLVAIAGFDADELEALLGDAGEEEGGWGLGGGGNTDPDDVPEPPAVPVSRLGDLWLLGPHRLLCGDCRDFDTATKLLGGVRVNVAFTSPPYASQRKYDESSGFRPIPPDEYVDWFEDVQANVRAVLADDGSWFVNIKEHCDDGQRHLYVKDLTIAHVRRWGWRFVDEFAWTRPAPPGRWPDRFKNGWEPVFHFAGAERVKFRPESVGYESDAVPVKSSEIGANTKVTNGAYWNRSSGNTTGLAFPHNVVAASGVETGTGHVAAFPVALPSWFIRAYSDPGDIVFDPFMGSGTTLIAAHQENRIGYGCEISPAYVDVICRRYQEHTGTVPQRLLPDGILEPHDFTAG